MFTCRTLGHRVDARYWGPGQFREALPDALADQLIRPAGGGRYELVDPPVPAATAAGRK